MGKRGMFGFSVCNRMMLHYGGLDKLRGGMLLLLITRNILKFCKCTVCGTILIFSPDVFSTALSQNSTNNINWQPCINKEFHGWFELFPVPSNLRCGYLEVLLQYQSGGSVTHPENKKTVKLALALLPAKGE
ncbi:hypothetical protein JP88_004370 [Salmonella enterica subsp. enterica]|nr:hypothetical protein [Salmonella enterica]ECF3780406.1 hypothetical protein [Salmonella enterica subsp. enterica serovar Oslo]EDR2105587.1 hypothetical protein [Salmonella enterica subsp. enterica]EDW0612953.1 hypothetical protein [Salmonella enterica subsp. enterica serovar Ball]EGZ4377864.1 hypothetical protein [Salmonella enterica subsp. enterica serovar Lexington]